VDRPTHPARRGGDHGHDERPRPLATGPALTVREPEATPGAAQSARRLQNVRVRHSRGRICRWIGSGGRSRRAWWPP
jgi:hypothetical protein